MTNQTLRERYISECQALIVEANIANAMSGFARHYNDTRMDQLQRNLRWLLTCSANEFYSWINDWYMSQRGAVTA